MTILLHGITTNYKLEIANIYDIHEYTGLNAEIKSQVSYRISDKNFSFYYVKETKKTIDILVESAKFNDKFEGKLK